MARAFPFQRSPRLIGAFLEHDGDKILAMEHNFQKGSVVLLADSRTFNNGSIVGLHKLDLISAAIGDKNHVVFDEQHFGMVESGTVVGLARRFRLMGMAAGLAFCAALFLWKNAASFPPPVDAPQNGPQCWPAAHPSPGLNTLLQADT